MTRFAAAAALALATAPAFADGNHTTYIPYSYATSGFGGSFTTPLNYRPLGGTAVVRAPGYSEGNTLITGRSGVAENSIGARYDSQTQVTGSSATSGVILGSNLPAQ